MIFAIVRDLERPFDRVAAAVDTLDVLLQTGSRLGEGQRHALIAGWTGVFRPLGDQDPFSDERIALRDDDLRKRGTDSGKDNDGGALHEFGTCRTHLALFILNRMWRRCLV